MAGSRIKLDHCVVHVTEWDRSNRFYRDVLGAELIDRGCRPWRLTTAGEELLKASRDLCARADQAIDAARSSGL